MKKIIALLSILSLSLLASCNTNEVVEEENTNTGEINVEMEEVTSDEENNEETSEEENNEESSEEDNTVEADAETETSMDIEEEVINLTK